MALNVGVLVLQSVLACASGAPEVPTVQLSETSASEKPVDHDKHGFIKFGLGWHMEGARLGVGGEWTKTKPFWLRVPLGTFTTFDLSISKEPLQPAES